MTAMTEWTPLVQVEVQNVPYLLMVDAIRQSAIEFCERTRVWRYELTPFDTTVDQAGDPVSEYTLTVASESRVTAIESLTYDGRPLIEQGMDWLDENDPGWRTKTGSPYQYVLRDNGKILLDRLPPEGVEMAGTVALKPTQTGTAVGDVVFNDYREAITAGALERLRMMADKPWSNPNDAQYARATFDRIVTDATSRNAYTTRRVIRSRAWML